MAKTKTVKKTTKKVVKKKNYEPKTGRNGGRITKKRWEEILTDGQELVEDGTFSQYSDSALGEKWKISRVSVRKVKEVLFADSKDNLMLRRARWAGMYDRLERNMSNILHRAENIKTCQSRPCSLELGYRYEGEEDKCPHCGIPMVRDLSTQVILSEKIPDLMERATEFLERFGMKDKVADKIDVNAKQTNIQINYNNQINFVKNLDKKLEGITDEKTRQAIVVDLMQENSSNTKDE